MDLNITHTMNPSWDPLGFVALLRDKTLKKGIYPRLRTIWWGDMLVLTRRIGESINIGEDIEIVVTAIEQNKVKLGIRSPRHVPVYRQELYQRIKNDNREAAKMKTDDLEQMLGCLPEEGGSILDQGTD